MLSIVLRIDLEERSSIPEIEIKYETFRAKAIEIAENSMDLNKFAEVAAPVLEAQTDCRVLVGKSKNLLETDFKYNASERRKQKNVRRPQV